MSKSNEYAAAEAQLDMPLTNRGFLAGCALIAEAILSPVSLQNDREGDNLIDMMQNAIRLFVIDKACFDDQGN